MYSGRGRFPAFVSSAVLAAAALAGCNRSTSDRNATPAAELKTDQAAQPANQPVTLTGCLRAGDAADTFILTTSAAADGTAPATYQLAAANGVALRDQIGKRVQVNGIVRSQQQTESHASGAAANTPAGTSGHPTVETTTEVDINHLDVSNMQPLGDRCDK
jgi:ABC-type uncharacterized transport system auxiliary subunit